MAIKSLFFRETLTCGGAEKVLCNLVNEMDQSVFDITVHTLWRAVAEKHLKPGIRYRYCYAAKNKVNGYRSRIEASLGLTYPLYVKDAYDIEVAYLEFGATKVLSHSTNKKAKKVAWVHSDLERKLAGRTHTILKAAEQYKAYDRIVCVSQTAKKGFVRLFGREEDVSVVYNTVDDAAIRQKAELAPAVPLQIRRLTAVTAGRLSSEKQYDMLLRMHKSLLTEGIAHDLWIVGEGDQRGILEDYIARNNLNDSVTLFGFQNNPYPYMKAADLLVCSSRYEGLSTFVTEGLILGKPVVTTECSGMRELLGDSKFGKITENNEEALRAGMRQLLSNDEMRSSLAERASERGRAFSARQLTEKTEQFFLNLSEE